jgi:hypothetical protein
VTAQSRWAFRAEAPYDLIVAVPYVKYISITSHPGVASSARIKVKMYASDNDLLVIGGTARNCERQSPQIELMEMESASLSFSRRKINHWLLDRYLDSALDLDNLLTKKVSFRVTETWPGGFGAETPTQPAQKV